MNMQILYMIQKNNTGPEIPRKRDSRIERRVGSKIRALVMYLLVFEPYTAYCYLCRPVPERPAATSTILAIQPHLPNRRHLLLMWQSSKIMHD